MNRVLIVDDEQSILNSLSWVLESESYYVDTALDGYKALELVNIYDYDLILLDIKMPGLDGVEVLDRIMKIKEDAVVIMISGHGTVETAVESTKIGAYNFLQKPFSDLDVLKLEFRNAINYKKSKDEIKKFKQELAESSVIVGRSEKIYKLKELIKKYAVTDSNILITGESGTGKTIIARQIHLNSKRSDKRFIDINCGYLNESNINEELFGLFQNNRIVSIGKIFEAQGSSLLFDEVCNLSMNIQPEILKVIEENKFTRKGQEGEIKIDVRFIFSTNRDIELETGEGRFRVDLFHRINALVIDIPPLRQRTEDIEDLVVFFTEHFSKIYNIPAKKFSESAINTLKSYRFPGNVRELKNFIERILFSVDKNVIDAEDIELSGTKHLRILTDLLNKNMSLNEFQNESEKIFIQKVLNDYQYNVSRTAEALKIQRSHLYKLMNKYDIPLPREQKK